MVGLPQYDAMNNAVFTRIRSAPRARLARSANEQLPPGPDANASPGAPSTRRVPSNTASAATPHGQRAADATPPTPR